jgi:hypothetical protein
LLGKRDVHDASGLELLCTKGGELFLAVAEEVLTFNSRSRYLRQVGGIAIWMQLVHE